MSLRFLVESHYARVRSDAAFWREHVEEIARRHGLSMQVYEPARGEATNPVFFVGDAVVKLYTPHFHGRESNGMEVAVLRALASDPHIPVAKVRAFGDLLTGSGDWNWPYVVMNRVEGRVLDADWHELPPEDRHALLRQLGAFLARLHRLPPSAQLGNTYKKLWPRGFGEFLARQLDALKGNLDIAALPIGDDVRDFQLPPASHAWPMILHGDVEPPHIFVRGSEVAALIDFGDAKLGDPLYDFVSIRKTMATDQASLSALFQGYGSDPRTTPEGRAKLALYTVLHEWTKPAELSKWCARSGARTVMELGEHVWN